MNATAYGLDWMTSRTCDKHMIQEQKNKNHKTERTLYITEKNNFFCGYFQQINKTLKK